MGFRVGTSHGCHHLEFEALHVVHLWTLNVRLVSVNLGVPVESQWTPIGSPLNHSQPPESPNG